LPRLPVPWSSCLCFCHSWVDRYGTMPNFFILRWDLMNIFPRLAWSYGPPNNQPPM
jgi:hypothetical protein